MKKSLTLIMATLLCVISIGTLSGCNLSSRDPLSHLKNDNGYTYVLIDRNGRPTSSSILATNAVILWALSTEELIIPEKLGGYTVKQIGITYQVLGGALHTYQINGTDIKRVVINHDVNIYGGLKNFKGYLIVNYPIRFYVFYNYKYTMQINCDPNLMEDYEENIEFLGKNQREIKFDAVGGEKTTWTTIIWKDNLLPEPEKPVKEGYEFVGWYVDEAYETEWNFEEDTVSESMTLYAKWI